MVPGFWFEAQKYDPVTKIPAKTSRSSLYLFICNGRVVIEPGNMRYLLLIVFGIMFGSSAIAQPDTPSVTSLSAAQGGVTRISAAAMKLDRSLLKSYDGLDLSSGWRLATTDDTAIAGSGYDDSRLPLVSATLEASSDSEYTFRGFNGIVWLRKSVWVDTSILNKPLALVIKHFGASELYLDGKRVYALGIIGDKNTTLYHYARTESFTVSFATAGVHTFAMRYANFNAIRNERIFHAELPGFSMRIGNSNRIVAVDAGNDVSVTFLLSLLFGIFIALAVAHLSLYLYQPAIRSNLYFTILCFALAMMYFLPWLSMFSVNPMWKLTMHFTLPLTVAAVLYSMSGFVNELFADSKRRFHIIGMAAVVSIIMYVVEQGIGIMALIGLLIFVLLEAIVLIIRAMVRRVKGARIIGLGMLIYTVFVFITTLYLSVFRSISFDGGAGGGLFLILSAVAILALPVSMSVYIAWNFAAVNKDLKANLAQVQELSEKNLQQEAEKLRLIETQKEKLETEVQVRTAQVVQQKDEIERQHSELKKEKQKSDDLLLNILPAEVADELKDRGNLAARSFSDVTVLFTDFVDFTKAAERMEPQQLVDELHVCFRNFDEIMARYHMEKIKTIGDAYLAVCGLPAPDPDHAINTVKAAKEILQFMNKRSELLGDQTFRIRIGINSGSVVAGIVGIKKYAYDIWGDAVNIAARMEQSGVPGRINISEATYQLVKDLVPCTYRGRIDAKNKGELNMYFVEI